jgi:hypothetical protein
LVIYHCHNNGNRFHDAMAAQELPRALYCGPNCEILQNVSHRKSDVSGTFRMAAGGVMNCCADVAFTLFVARST